jgi:DNA polymerase alpha subunit A
MQETDVMPSKLDVMKILSGCRRSLVSKGLYHAYDEKDVPKEGEWIKFLYSFEGNPQSLNFWKILTVCG